ncbi:MAG: bacillithiol biosynthesis deacetylase BshB1 [Coriobacteriia bacterium]
MLDALCIGAHPDDVEIGMGGTVAGMVRRGKSVAILDLTDGEPTPFGAIELRAAEARAAAATLGVERITLDMPNRYLFDSAEARQKVAGVIRRLRPRILFVPFPEDSHPDHIAANSIAEAARFYAKFTKTDMPGEPHYPARVYRYMAVHARLIREPSFIVDISADLNTKMEALGCYDSQFTANPANQGVLASVAETAAMWGSTARVAAGEPFFSVEPVAVLEVEGLL